MTARLEGGPFDGAEETLDAPVPSEVRAWRCPLCDEIHIARPSYAPPNRTLLRYRFDRHDPRGAVYVYGEYHFLGTPNREKELVDA